MVSKSFPRSLLVKKTIRADLAADAAYFSQKSQ